MLKQSKGLFVILYLLNTFEKPFHPEIGGNVRGLLFENMTPLTGAVISRKVEDCQS